MQSFRTQLSVRLRLAIVPLLAVVSGGCVGLGEHDGQLIWNSHHYAVGSLFTSAPDDKPFSITEDQLVAAVCDYPNRRVPVGKFAEVLSAEPIRGDGGPTHREEILEQIRIRRRARGAATSSSDHVWPAGDRGVVLLYEEQRYFSRPELRWVGFRAYLYVERNGRIDEFIQLRHWMPAEYREVDKGSNARRR